MKSAMRRSAALTAFALLTAAPGVMYAAGAPAVSGAHPSPARRAGAPVPYRSEEVRVRTRDGQTLAGTLTLPLAGSRHPAMLLLSSVVAQDRDASNIHGAYHPFRQIADTLSRNGIAVLRLDDRGVGRSTGRLDTLTTEERANDARDALAFLRRRRDVDAKRLGVLGHSEGANIAMMLAADDTSLKAVISMAGTARPGREVVDWMVRAALASERVAPAVRGQMFQQEMQAWRDRIAKERWVAYFDTCDPGRIAMRVHVPALLMQGGADTSCPPDEVRVLDRTLLMGGNKDVTVRMFDGYDHAFLRIRDFQNGVPYGDGAYLLSSEVLGVIVEWSVKKLR
jgi:dienelactone hydrolase